MAKRSAAMRRVLAIFIRNGGCHTHGRLLQRPRSSIERPPRRSRFTYAAAARFANESCRCSFPAVWRGRVRPSFSSAACGTEPAASSHFDFLTFRLLDFCFRRFVRRVVDPPVAGRIGVSPAQHSELSTHSPSSALTVSVPSILTFSSAMTLPSHSARTIHSPGHTFSTMNSSPLRPQ